MEEKIYWIWLSLVFPYGSNKPCQILSFYDSPKEFYQLDKVTMLSLGFLTQSDVDSLKGTSLKRAEKIIRECDENGIKIVTFYDEEYPGRLRNIYAPPIVLYMKGSIAGIDDEVAITVVGTRRASDYSASVTEFLCSRMAAAGAVIISGCALGIDSFAHWGALHGGGKTIAVLGCGLNVDYPPANRELKKQILKRGGALVSEMPPGEEAFSKIFPVRNRIMAGLALGVLVIQAPERSGSLITAGHAIEQGKDVFCVPPYSIFDANFTGVIRYLRDGAIPVFSAEDVLGTYANAYANKLDVSRMGGDYMEQKKVNHTMKKIVRQRQEALKQEESVPEIEVNEEAARRQLKEKYIKLISSFDEKQLLVYNKLELNPQPVDDLVVQTGIKVGDLLPILTEFEIMGLVTSHEGSRFSLSVK